MHDTRSRTIRRGLVVAAAAAVVLAIGVIALRNRSGPASTSNDPATSGAPEFLALELAGSASASPIPPDSSTPRAQVLGKTTVAEAIAVARPLMTNTSGRLDTGSALLSLWAADRLTWEALESLPETSAALFRRDPEAERGKRLCMSGTILEIRAEKTLAARLEEDRALPLIEPPAPTVHTDPASGTLAAPAESWAQPGGRPLGDLEPSGDWTIPHDGKVYVATVREKAESSTDASAGLEPRRAKAVQPLVVEVIAVKSSGNLVDGSEARVCGILTGVTLTTLPAETMGSVTEHRIVGMFDLPDNRGHHRGA